MVLLPLQNFRRDEHWEIRVFYAKFFDLIVKSLNLTGEQAVLIPKAGHIVWDDATEPFMKTVTGWFDKL